MDDRCEVIPRKFGPLPPRQSEEEERMRKTEEKAGLSILQKKRLRLKRKRRRRGVYRVEACLVGGWWQGEPLGKSELSSRGQN